MPQPICSPASSEPPASLVLPPPVIVPVNVPEIRYSRDEMAVVSGATGSWVSLEPTTLRCQPSGVSRIPGAAEGTAPVSTGGGSGRADRLHRRIRSRRIGQRHRRRADGDRNANSCQRRKTVQHD